MAAATNKSGSIIFIGHSRATITSFMYMSENPQEAQKFIRSVVALSPAAYLDFSFHLRIVARLSPLILNIIPVVNYPVKYSVKFYQILCTFLPYVCKLYLIAVSGSAYQFLPVTLPTL